MTSSPPVFRPGRFLLVALLMLASTLPACGSRSSAPQPSPDSSLAPPPPTGPARERSEATPPSVDARTRAWARRLAARTDSAFQTVTPLSDGEVRRLRRYLQPQHIERARRLGLDPVPDRQTAARLGARSDSTAIRLSTNRFYIVDPSMSYAVPLVVPSAARLLHRLGQRFQEDLMAQGLPPYRFILTNVLRTGQDQSALRGGNVNAARGQSTHEYGTTFDVFYEWFHYAAASDTRTQALLPDSVRTALDETLLQRRLYAAYRQDGRTHARKIKAVLGRTILTLQDEGLLLATYERRQPVFHLTLARHIEAPARNALARRAAP